MSVLTAIAHEFPLLAAIAHELGEADDPNAVARLRMARGLLRDAFRSLDHTPDTWMQLRQSRRSHRDEPKTTTLPTHYVFCPDSGTVRNRPQIKKGGVHQE